MCDIPGFKKLWHLLFLSEYEGQGFSVHPVQLLFSSKFILTNPGVDVIIMTS